MENRAYDIPSSITLALKLENPVAALERLLSKKIPKEVKKRLVRELLKSILSMDITAIEKDELSRILYTSTDILGTRNQALSSLEQKRAVPVVERAEIGKTKCLFAVDPYNGPFGVIHPVAAVSIEDGKGEHKVIVNELTGDISLAVHTVHEALRFTLERYGLLQEGFIALDNYGITVQIGRFDSVYDGSSLGLAVSAAVMSSLLGVPISSCVAFTGTVNIRAEVGEIDGLKEKLKIAALKGIKRVYVPYGNGGERGVFTKHMEIFPVSTLEEVFDGLFTREKLTSFVELLNKRKKGSNIVKIPRLSEKKRLLISTVGMRDPYGRSYQDGGGGEFSEGPILTAYRRLVPDQVLLLPTRESLKNAENTKKEIERFAGADICHAKLLDIPDPTDYDAIFIGVLAALKSMDGMIEDREVFLSISSGTPQMHAVFIELVRSKRLNACLIQVKEPRFASSWEDRVKPIRSEYLGIV
ncbi:MAG: hypothetical protein N2745_11135 [Syntrophorhabdaceae bacterium]|nr:hypothetical protein [Syntrophorhabdaceae bacterium]